MNRLVIIGNGFDLAHGLPTGYRDFIDDYWKQIDDDRDDEFISLKLDLISNEFNSFEDLLNKFRLMAQQRGRMVTNDDYTWGIYTRDSRSITVLSFKNNFFGIICQKKVENWVDIENIYYEILKVMTKRNGDIHQYKGDIHRLNKEFEQVKNLLEKYLKSRVIDNYELGLFPDSKGDLFKFKDIIKPISIFSKEENLLEEFPSNNHDEIKEQFDYEVQGVKSNTKLFFLDFNYTPTVYRYLNSNGKYDGDIETFVNFIHGEVGNDTHNKINFGFGDEMDDDYKMIENLNDNEYLRNFKSFQYLQNSNYKTLLDFVETENFQVYIMGHSCGLSDRTLLNTIFEHNNCRSIKVFYYQKDDGTDNYTEIARNISRHFNKKKLMREKIVNKTLCQPLPQIQLPEKIKTTQFHIK